MVVVGLSFLIGPILCKKGGPFCVSKLHIKGLKIYSHSFATKSYFFVFIGQKVLFFCANLLPKIVPKLTNNLLILGLIFALFFELSFVLFLYFLGCVLGFLELFWQASVAKNRDKLGVFSCFEDYAYCLIYVSDDGFSSNPSPSFCRCVTKM